MSSTAAGPAGRDRVVERCDAWPALPDPRLLVFLRHWAERRQGLTMPRRAIDPLALRSCLPHVWLHRYREDSSDFVCVLAGEQVNAAWGGNIAGRPLAEIIQPDQAALTQARYRQVMQLPGVQVVRRLIQPADAAAKATERVIVPVDDGSGRPWGVFGMTLYHFDPVAGADLPVNPHGDAVLYLCTGLPAAPP
ncbi:PAS domain-containing protein [Ferrovibrio sp.]|uniref:PAS domain-containing protein n=1 Tax=Ferrovibrio sp. TaxID=1917215 RepID=UPI00311F3758